jgi:hypothetical protein
MFKAIVLACAIANPTDCVEFHDVRGPYMTQEECEERAFEMARDIGEKFNDVMAKAWRCKPLPKGVLSTWNPSL